MKKCRLPKIRPKLGASYGDFWRGNLLSNFVKDEAFFAERPAASDDGLCLMQFFF
jgi:hypothetical protein